MNEETIIALEGIRKELNRIADMMEEENLKKRGVFVVHENTILDGFTGSVGGGSIFLAEEEV